MIVCQNNGKGMYMENDEISQDEIIQLACDCFGGLIKKEERANFLAFAKALVEKERETCAKVCEIPPDWEDWEILGGSDGRELCNSLAEALRARTTNE